eukprot:SAG22_NODE_10461_length_534_cov_0.949425_1_plen_142_part_01
MVIEKDSEAASVQEHDREMTSALVNGPGADVEGKDPDGPRCREGSTRGCTAEKDARSTCRKGGGGSSRSGEDRGEEKSRSQERSRQGGGKANEEVARAHNTADLSSRSLGGSGPNRKAQVCRALQISSCTHKETCPELQIQL